LPLTGRAVRCEVVAEGFNIANGITLRDSSIYLAETDLNAGTPHKSGVYRLELSALDPDNPLRVRGLGDPHLITVLETKSEAYKVGAKGVAFNSKGDLFVCNFGDAEVIRCMFQILILPLDQIPTMIFIQCQLSN
jgi:hypothetical protein